MKYFKLNTLLPKNYPTHGGPHTHNRSPYPQHLFTYGSLPEEVLLAEHLGVPYEAGVGELFFARRALEALCVPGLVQNLQDEAVQNEQTTPYTLGDGGWKLINRKWLI